MKSYFDNFISEINYYSFNTSWVIAAPLEVIWNTLIDYKKWPVWCHGLKQIEPLDKFNYLRKGNNIRSRWEGIFPYSITFDVAINEFSSYSFLSFNVTGDLSGEGICYLSSSKDDTNITFILNVSPTKLWMKITSPFMRPFFKINHHYIMNNAVKQLSRMLD